MKAEVENNIYETDPAAEIPAHLVSSGVALNTKFHPTVVRSDNGLAAFTDMLRAFFDIGGMHIQPNVVGAETLLDAQRHPGPPPRPRCKSFGIFRLLHRPRPLHSGRHNQPHRARYVIRKRQCVFHQRKPSW